VLSFLKRKPEPVAQTEQRAAERVRRRQQENIKVSADCSAFTAFAEVRDFSKAAVMVAEREQQLELRG
jgi:hypothetical protein